MKQIVKTNEDLAFIIANEVKEMKTAMVDLKIEMCKSKG